MKHTVTNFDLGDRFIITAENADEWVSVIGQPLADAIKAAAKNPNASAYVVTLVDPENKTVTIGRAKET